MRPLLSLLLPGAEDATTLRTVRSVARNGRGPWELVISPRPASAKTRRVARTLLRGRLRYAVAGSPDLALRDALTASRGTHVAVVAPGDEIEPGVLSAMTDYLAARSGVDVLYTDDQWPAPGSAGIQTKPHWVPRYLEGWDYLGRLCSIRRSLIDEVGGFRDGFSGAEEWDLHLRATERTEAIEHLSVIGVTRLSAPDNQPDVVEAGRRAVADRYRRLGVPAVVEVAHRDGYLRVWREVADPPQVTIVIPTGGGRRDIDGEPTPVLRACLRSLVEQTTYPLWDVVLVASEATPDETLAEARETLGQRLTLAPVTGAFSFSHSINEGVRLARGELVVLLNDDTEIVEPRWLDRMVAVAQDRAVGVVGAKLHFEDGTIQHVGILHGDDWLPVHVHRGAADDASHFGTKIVDVDHMAVTAACLLTPRDLFIELGGLSERLPLAFNDVDYCYKVVAAGRAVVCAPFARLNHYESSSRVPEVRSFERQYLIDHTVRFAQRDPWVNWRSVS